MTSSWSSNWIGYPGPPLDFAGLLQRSQGEGWTVVALDLGLDLSKPDGSLGRGVMDSVAEWGRATIGASTSDARAQAKRRGRLPGRRSALPRSVQDLLIEMDDDGTLTLRERAEILNGEGILTGTGIPWAVGSVMLRRGRRGWNGQPLRLRGMVA